MDDLVDSEYGDREVMIYDPRLSSLAFQTVPANETGFHMDGLNFNTRCFKKNAMLSFFSLTQESDAVDPLNKPFTVFHSTVSTQSSWMVFKCGASQFRNHITHYMQNLNTISQRSNNTIFPCYVVEKNDITIAYFSIGIHTVTFDQSCINECKAFIVNAVDIGLRRQDLEDTKSASSTSTTSRTRGRPRGS